MNGQDGGLRAAIVLADTSYEIGEDGHIDGFQYNLLLEVAHELNIPLEMEPVSFASFFEKNGSIPEEAFIDPEYRYTPDLLNESDIFVAAISPLPWRENFLSFIPLFPNKMVFVVRAGEAVMSREEMISSAKASSIYF